MLQQVIERGTGRAARSVLPRDVVVVGKSGTTQDLRDSWFAGFSGSHLAVVWVGYDDNRPTGFTGAAAALAIWSRVLADLGTTSWSAAMPESLNEVAIDYFTGLQIEGTCANSDTIRIGVPPSTQLAKKPGCIAAAAPSAAGRLVERLRAIIHQ
jgi:penicillin-binding protein 1B